MVKSAEAGPEYTDTDIDTGEIVTVRSGCPNSTKALQWGKGSMVVPDACGGNTCRWCVFQNIKRWVDALELAQPTGLLTLTQTGADPKTITDRMGRFRQFIRRVEPGWQDLWTAEPYFGDQTHTHVWFTGSVPDIEAIAKAARQAKLGFDLDLSLHDPVKASAGQRLGYSLKSFIDYDDDYRARALEINSGRLGHASSGFFRDGPGGAPINNLGEVTELLRFRRHSTTPQPRVVRLAG